MGRIIANDLTYTCKDSTQETISGKITINIDLDGINRLAVFCLAHTEVLRK